MKNSVFLLAVLGLFIVSSCTEDKSFASHETEGSAKWALASYFDLINAGEYDKSLALFAADPVAAGEITMDFYKQYVDENISKAKTITSLSLSEKQLEGMSNKVEITINFKYKNGEALSKWVIVEKVDEIWKLTTRGSLF